MRRPARACLALACLLAALLAAGCEREARRFESAAADPAPNAPQHPRAGSLQPAQAQDGGVRLPATPGNPYEGNALAVAEGKRLYRWYNCNGCHASGGGGMGPALMDAQWLYGGNPSDVFASIAQGRPQGMPSFGGHIPDDQLWKIVAYVRSMSGQLRKDVEPSRSDTLSGGEPEGARRPEQPRPADIPPKPAMGASQ